MAVPRLAKGLAAAAALLVLYANYEPARRATAVPQPQPRRDSLERPEPAREAGARAQAGAAAVVRAAAAAGRRSAATQDVHRVDTRIPVVNAVATSRRVGSLPKQCNPMPDKERLRLLDLVPEVKEAPSCQSSLLCDALNRALSSALPMNQQSQKKVLVTSVSAKQMPMLQSFLEATGALRLHTIVLSFAQSEAAPELASYGPTASAVALQSGRELHDKWDSIAQLLRAGVGVLYTDVDAVIAADPFELLHTDSDLEALSEAWDEDDARGFIMGSDDPSMGWSRYCESMRIAFLDPSFFYLSPTRPAAALASRLAALASAHRWPSAAGAAWASSTDEATALSMEALAPAYDDYSRVGATVRVLQFGCWLGDRTSTHGLERMVHSGERPAIAFAGRKELPEVALRRHRAAVERFHRGGELGETWKGSSPLPSRWMLERTRMDGLMFMQRQLNRSKDAVLKSKCKREPVNPSWEGEGMGGARKLRLLVQPEASVWPVGCDNAKELCEVVSKVAIDRAVMAAVSNGNILMMLGQFVDVVQRVGVSNFMVVALDERTADFLDRKKCARYLRKLRSRTGLGSEGHACIEIRCTGHSKLRLASLRRTHMVFLYFIERQLRPLGSTDNHATSGLKFQILFEMLSVGVSVLLSDVDIVITQNPFAALYRDSDVEGMSDGWDELTAYGHVHELPVLGSTMHSVRIVARNSGLFYLAATHECLRLMRQLAETMATVAVWDQSAFNMEIFRAAYGQKVTAGVSVRVMSFLCFVNTKLLFKYMRYDPQLGNPGIHQPVTVHMNYHPEKEARMVDVNRFYHQRDRSALSRWNGGEGLSSRSCRGKVGVQTDKMPALQPSELTMHTLVKSLLARRDPWLWRGYGRIWFEDNGMLRAEAPLLSGATWGTVPSPWRKDALHIKWVFVALRCEDEQVTYGQLDTSSVPEQRLVF